MYTQRAPFFSFGEGGEMLDFLVHNVFPTISQCIPKMFPIATHFIPYLIWDCPQFEFFYGPIKDAHQKNFGVVISN